MLADLVYDPFLSTAVCTCMDTGRFGFYRVNYSEPLWTALAAASILPQAQISSVDFAGVFLKALSSTVRLSISLHRVVWLSGPLGRTR